MVYHGQAPINPVNMRAGDGHVVSNSKRLIKTKRWYQVHQMIAKGALPKLLGQ